MSAPKRFFAEHISDEMTLSEEESRHARNVLRLAEGGFGVAVLPASLAEGALAEGRLRRIQVTDGAFFRRYYLAYLTQKYRSPALERVMEAVRAFFAAAEPR